jgi:hypothetical protein
VSENPIAPFKTAAFDHSATHPIKFFQCFERIFVWLPLDSRQFDMREAI